MPVDARPARPVRRAFGILAGLVAAADLAVPTAGSGNSYGVPVAGPASRPRLLAYGAVLLVVGLWAVASSYGREGDEPAVPQIAEVTTLRPTADNEAEERTVIHALRSRGWYVADDVLLPHV